ncbi:hypothetical protein FQR65_LT09652 [Abscondita terminalis]|nr:hypothetical protein FQR65_LT09652 [Abscondita terminalis]
MFLIFYPENPHRDESYHPYGHGQLTNKGKCRAYALGQFLRQRYDQFLGLVYDPNVLEAVSSGYTRASDTLSFVLDGMYSRDGERLQCDESINIQPVVYEQTQQQNYLTFPMTTCLQYQNKIVDYLHSDEVKAKTMIYQPLIDYLEKHSGVKINSLPIILFFYDILKTQQEWGLKLPGWSKQVYPNIMQAATVDAFRIFSGTTDLKRLASGALLKKIVDDTENIINNKTQPPEKRLFVYSGHDFNIVFLQIVLGIFREILPSYAACLILEVHEINHVYGVQIYYITELEDEPEQMKMPGCDYFCPFEKFYDLVQKYFPTDDLFRHGHRTTDNISPGIYQQDPFKKVDYYPYGYGQLTNKGKLRAFALGRWLRERYNEFLGIVYDPNILEAVSSGYNRTTATLSLVLASLYPPKSTSLEWNENLNWQPVLYQQLPDRNYLTFSLLTCLKYQNEFLSHLNSTKTKEITFFYQPLIKYLQNKTGVKMNSLMIVFYVYDILRTQQEWGLKLPEWSEPIYPNIMYAAIIDIYGMFSGTRDLKRLGSGALLRKILNDTANKITNKTQPPERKLYIYSGHDFNIAFMQSILGVFTKARPAYASCLILEVHEIENVYGIKIYYDTKSEGDPRLLKMPGCDYFCPFKKFYKLVKDYLPTKDVNCDNPTLKPYDVKKMFALM